jgi:hypothetical protein
VADLLKTRRPEYPSHHPPNFSLQSFPHTAGLHRGHSTVNFKLSCLEAVGSIAADLRAICTFKLGGKCGRRTHSGLAMAALQKAPSVMGVPMKHISLITVWPSPNFF